jgi:hypothetical protein
MFIEVPCIDRALATGRTVDFYYEHNSHFTTESFVRMLGRCRVAVEHLSHGYDGEVVYACVRLEGQPAQVAHADESLRFHQRAPLATTILRRQLRDLHESGRSVAIWGGTGKSAAFIAQVGADASRFPIVVDSDPDKAGTFVPGTGQEIRSPDWLRAHPVEVVIIPPQWRARDIVREMVGKGLACEVVLIEHDGLLVDYFADEHPYPHGRRPPRWGSAPLPRESLDAVCAADD